MKENVGRFSVGASDTEPPGELARSNVTELTGLTRQALAGCVARDLLHEINDLLVGVVGVATDGMTYGSLLERRHALETVAQYGGKIAELVREFQEVLFVTSSGRVGPVDLQAVMDRVLRLCRISFTPRGVEIKRHHGSLPRVRAGIGSLEQIFVALIHSMLDTMSGGGVLELTAQRTGECVAVALSGTPSTGAGAATEPLSGGADAADGAGRPDACDRTRTASDLRIAVAQATIRRYGGELTAERTLGEIPRFVVRLLCSKQGSASPPHGETTRSDHESGGA